MNRYIAIKVLEHIYLLANPNTGQKVSNEHPFSLGECINAMNIYYLLTICNEIALTNELGALCNLCI